jgi:hypothetical protein
VERGRKVDAKLREIECWGIPEPGGAGGAKGLPTSFLVTALLSPQDDVSAVLRDSLQDDPTASGKERIAAALQAIAQDPLFVALLKETQARRDEAYTDKGAKKTAKGSVFKLAAERLNETRDEKDRLQKVVADSEGAERQLRDLTDRRAEIQERMAAATELVAKLEGLASQAANRSVAAEQVRLAQQEVLRIRKIGTEVEEAEREVAELVQRIGEAEQALSVAREQQVKADSELKAAEQMYRAEGSDPGMADMVVRQQLELRKSKAEQAEHVAQQRIDAALAAKKFVEAAASAERDLQDQQAKAQSALEALSQAEAKAKNADEELKRCELLERALDVLDADKRRKHAQAAVEKEALLRTRLEAATDERLALAGQRSAIQVPSPGALGPMRRLARERAAAMGALEVGLVITVSPEKRLALRVRKDGQDPDETPITRPLDIEANAEVEVSIPDIATVRVQGGRREAQEKAQELERRWSREVGPHLTAAGVTDLEGLEVRITEAQELEAAIKNKDAEIESLRAQISAFAGGADELREASEKEAQCRALLGNVELTTLAADIAALGADPRAGLRRQRERLLNESDAARRLHNQAETERTLADERTQRSRLSLDQALTARDAALPAFTERVDAALDGLRAAIATANAEKQSIAAEFASLERMIQEKKSRLDTALSGARTNAEQARIAVETAQGQLTKAKTDHATAHGRLTELRKRRDAENLAAAETMLQEATERHAALPVPDQIVADEDLSVARAAAAGLKLELERMDRDIQRAHGALEQVGGAVARERLRDATDAFELAERQEREIEAEYEAWRLLLEQMKEADAAQASNLGQALVPAIAERFQELTQRRYQSVQLNGQLATQGIVVSGALRSAEQISVGTREQLSTLYRLLLAEYLRSVIVLDDQLVQSDDHRMDWFRALLSEKARSFQIVVFTCRPDDYLLASALVPHGSAIHADTDGGLVRAIDLERALCRR